MLIKGYNNNSFIKNGDYYNYGEIIMKSKLWWCVNALFLIGSLLLIMICVYRIDPFFHYHEPLTDQYFYKLSAPRAQNNGIVRNFNYEGLITGASTAENFKTSEMDSIFGNKSVKVAYSGGTFKEIGDNVAVALKNNEKIKYVILGLDMIFFFDESDKEKDIAHAQDYLYDDNYLNDIQYLLDGGVVERTCSMIVKRIMGKEGGITSFDEYTNWMKEYKFGIKPLNNSNIKNVEYVHLSDEDKKVISDNINKNMADMAGKYPDVDFYYFITPYSAVWWNEQLNNGNIYRQIEAEEYIIELLLQHDNIHLYSFNNITHITTDLNNYKDNIHYGEWVNSFMLKAMHDGEYKLTKDNYKDYIAQELSFYTTYDYEQLNNQEDYEDDYKAAEMLANWKGTGRAEDLN